MIAHAWTAHTELNACFCIVAWTELSISVPLEPRGGLPLALSSAAQRQVVGTQQLLIFARSGEGFPNESHIWATYSEFQIVLKNIICRLKLL